MSVKRIRRILSLLLCIATLLMLETGSLFPTYAVDGDWDGVSIQKPAGEGTIYQPYLIASAENLAWISYMTAHVSEANAALGKSFEAHKVFEDTYFLQTADLDLGGRGFTPIGTTQATSDAKRNAFAGHYDGGGFQISNALILASTGISSTNRSTFMESGYRPIGIFGVLAEGASICDVNACNIKVGTLDKSKKSADQAYGAITAGVIVGTSFGKITVTGCSTDADCHAFGAYAAGGILGIPEGGATVEGCINRATVSADEASGGIVGYGYNTSISACVNEGTIDHFTFTRWSGAGGIMGAPVNLSANRTNSITDCINAATARVRATSAQKSGSGTNRVAVGGIIGNDNICTGAEMTYTNCYNLQVGFESVFTDNGNNTGNFLTACAGIAGYARDSGGGGRRTLSHCFSVSCSYLLNACGTKITYDCNFNPQANENTGAINPLPFSGLIICISKCESNSSKGFISALLL